MILAGIFCLISFILNLLSSFLYYKDFEKNHKDVDFTNSLLHFIIALLMILCIMLDVQAFINKRNLMPAQQAEVIQTEMKFLETGQ